MSSTNYEAFAAADHSLMALVDCDTFYASCERVARPDLHNRPVVVLSNNDGCIVARSREAKKLGIPMGVPAFQIEDQLRSENVAVFSSNYTLYGDLSHRVMETLRSIVPDVEVYSIDEAFVPLRGALATQPTDAARLMRQKIWKWVGLPVSIGIAPTRVLAKIATRIAKKFSECHGIYQLPGGAALEKLLDMVPVSELWGVGRKGTNKLLANGISTALELRNANPDHIRSLLTVNGLNILMELRGIPSIQEDVPATHHSIISSRSLGYKVTQLAPMMEAVAFHAARAAEKLRSKKLLSGMVGVGIQTALHALDRPQHNQTTFVRLPGPTMDTAKIIAAAHKALEHIYRTGYGYAKVMVILLDLQDPRAGQPELLSVGQSQETEHKRAGLMRLMDKINRLEGRGTLRFAAQGKPDASWHMNRARLSRAWTTRFQELLRVAGEPGQYKTRNHNVREI